MYIKVHKKDNQWFQVDTGALVGDAVLPGKTLENLMLMHGSGKNFAEMNNTIFVIYYGYIDNNNKFNHFCKKTSCYGCHPLIKKRFCHKNAASFSTAGYYLKV